jgi:MFS family permease
MFLGLVIGGVLSAISWRAVFFVSVPIGVLGTLWGYRSLRETSRRVAARIDWAGNLLFAVGLIAVLAAITYGIQPYGGHDMGWTNPWVLTGLIGGVAALGAFCVVELHIEQPMVDLHLFRVQAFAAGNGVALLAGIARGGLQFMLIIWLQGIWLPLHGYRFVDTPFWAGIYLLPLTAGFLVAGPLSGALSDRYGARAFATGGLLLAAATFLGLLTLPVSFGYLSFAALIFGNGVGFGLFAAPNTAAIMNSVPASQRGAASGVNTTFNNSGQLVSIGLFFSLMIAGLAGTLPHTLFSGLARQGVPAVAAHRVAGLPPVGSLFAAFLGYNPMQALLGGRLLGALPAGGAARLTGKQFFPHLISGPFHHGLVVVFSLAAGMAVVGAFASLLRGERYLHDELSTEPELTLPKG